MVFTHKTRVQIPAWKAFFQADLAEWLRRMLKAHVRKSVGSTPTVCTFLGSKTMKRVIRGSTVVSIPACHAGDPGSIPGLGAFFLFCGTKRTKMKGRARVEPATYRAATDCSTTELTPHDEKIAPCGDRTRDFWLIRPTLYQLS